MFVKKRNGDIMKERGFTLLELSLVILIAGILLLPLIQLYQNYYTQQKMDITRENISKVATVISSYSPIRLPCPTDRSLAPGNPNYGKEICNLAAIPNCTGALNQGICKTAGSRDADGVGGVDTVVIGGVPTIEAATGEQIRGMLGYMTFDGWNRRLTYAVSFNLMSTAKTDGKSDFKLGVVEAEDENGNQTAGVSIPGDAQYAIVSHGADGLGAFQLSGIMYGPCPAVGVSERENCDNDFLFRQGLGSTEGSAAGYYDDYVYFYIEASGDLWYVIPDAANNPSPHINNLNTDNIGIRTTTPADKLDVNGTISAATVRANTLCDKAGTNCMATSFFSSSRQCPTGYVMDGYSSSWPTCTKVDLTPYTGYPGVDCHSISSLYWVRSIMSNGCVICSDGTVDVKLPAGPPCN